MRSLLADRRPAEGLVVKRAATAIVLLLIASGSVSSRAAEPLGRLFFTPAQRTTLDAGKELDRPKQAGPAVRGPRSVTVNGVVTRSDGESTVWVNGRPADARRPDTATITAKPAGAASARVRVMDSDARLRVGQTLDRRTGKVTEAYQRKPAAGDGEATAQPAPAQGNGSPADRPPGDTGDRNDAGAD